MAGKVVGVVAIAAFYFGLAAMGSAAAQEARRSPEDAHKAIVENARQAKTQLEGVCAELDARWAWMRVSINGTVTTIAGCVGK